MLAARFPKGRRLEPETASRCRPGNGHPKGERWRAASFRYELGIRLEKVPGVGRDEQMRLDGAVSKTARREEVR